MPYIVMSLPWKGHPSPLPTFCTFADETLSLDGDSEQRKDLDQCPGRLDLTNSEKDNRKEKTFAVSREVKE